MDDQCKLKVVDSGGRNLNRGDLATILVPLIEKYLEPLAVLFPIILKLPDSGGAWLYAYVDKERGLRVQIPAGLLAELGVGGAGERVLQGFERRVNDLAANLRSRAGGRSHYFRRATTTLPSLERE